MDGKTLMPAGMLVLVVGASGAGKDTVLRGARKALAADPMFVFPMRHITRPAEPTEPHIPVSSEEYQSMLDHGAFALHWRAHGFGYGITSAIEAELGAGRIVVCNVSRGVVDIARRCWSRVRVIEIRLSPEVRVERLRGRAREGSQHLSQRLAREDDVPPVEVDLVISNDGHAAEAIDAFVCDLDGIVRRTDAKNRPS